MKTILMSFICTFMCFSLFAQVDSTNDTNINKDSSVTNPMPPPTTDSTPMKMNTDTSANMNSMKPTSAETTNSMTPNTTMSSNTMNMNGDSGMSSNLSNPKNIPGQMDYAALPVLETFVPDNIVADVKQKYQGQVVYDITAIKAPVDSSMMQNDSMAMNQNHSMNQDSSANRNSVMNQNSMSNSNNGMPMDSTTQQPEKFDYVVRVMQGGQLTTEKLETDGTGTALNTVGIKNE